MKVLHGVLIFVVLFLVSATCVLFWNYSTLREPRTLVTSVTLDFKDNVSTVTISKFGSKEVLIAEPMAIENVLNFFLSNVNRDHSISEFPVYEIGIVLRNKTKLVLPVYEVVEHDDEACEEYYRQNLKLFRSFISK